MLNPGVPPPAPAPSTTLPGSKALLPLPTQVRSILDDIKPCVGGSPEMVTFSYLHAKCHTFANVFISKTIS